MSKTPFLWILVVFLAMPPVANAADTAELLRQFAADPSAASPEARAQVLQTLGDLVSSDPTLTAASLSAIQVASNLPKRLARTGFAYLPSQVDELAKAFDGLRGAWESGQISAGMLRDTRKLVGVLQMLDRVRRDVLKAIPRTEIKVLSLGGNLVVFAAEASTGPLMVAKAVRGLTAIYRNHLGAAPYEVVENYFTRLDVPVFAPDFNHYSFARQLALLEAIRWGEALPDLSAEMRNTLDGLWLESFIETAHQMRGLAVARESGDLITALYQVWAESLRRLEQMDEPVALAVGTLLEVMSKEPEQIRGVKPVLTVLQTLLEESLTPTAGVRHGYLSSWQSRLTTVRANQTHFGLLTAYLEELGMESGRAKRWFSLTTLAKGSAITCGLIGRICSKPISIAVGGAQLAFQPWRQLRNLLHFPSELDRDVVVRCEDLLYRVRHLQGQEDLPFSN